ncbi:PREDICTED: 8-oxo-dGDP phosphatase NUDT18-like [Priapulus caudatus]|uniref:8-oxo-dGDP phosphatase NUDT18-like n=1 Tax=Priapulus caudatus TaxID=37621 RepID=A0ABM1EBZ6_PRICU|nr:PREDICTED: 8-oxo-dGDP phosphatase NUDT18-like [Priapulus caudatus]
MHLFILGAHFEPLIKQTVCYIVCGLIYNENGEVLLIQEAKQSCRGKWYLPAGRMEVEETIEEALKREVKEEAGFCCEITTLLLVEIDCGARWVRFTCLARVTGGHLKSKKEMDKESLQARWCSTHDISQLEIRAHDIFPLMEYAEQFRSLPASSRHCNVLPTVSRHKRLLVRAVIVKNTEASKNAQVLIGKKSGSHFPVGTIGPGDYGLCFSIARIVRTALGGGVKAKLVVHGILAVEHCGAPALENDGLCFTCLASIGPRNNIDDYDTAATLAAQIAAEFSVSEPPEVATFSIACTDYAWLSIVDDQLSQELLGRLGKYMTIPTNRNAEFEEMLIPFR